MGAPHREPIVLINRSTDQANLIILPVASAVRPGESVKAELPEQLLPELSCHSDLSLCGGLRRLDHSQPSAGLPVQPRNNLVRH